MGYVFNPGALIGLVSSLVMVLLGIAVLQASPKRRDALAFGIFTIHWGLFGACLSTSLMAADLATLKPWVYAYVATGIPLYLSPLVFVSTFPTAWNPLGRNPVAMGLVALPGLLALVLLGTEPTLFVEGFQANPQPPHSALFGALGIVAGLIATQFAFAFALGVVLYQLTRARDETERGQFVLLTAGFLAYVSYRAADVLHVSLLATEVPGWPWPLVLRLAAALLALAVTLAALWIALDRSRTHQSLPWRDLLLACATVPLLLGLFERGLIRAGISGFRTDGIWRLVTVGLFAYAVARKRLFDLDLRVRATATTAAYVIAPIAAVLLLWRGLGSSLAEAPLLAVTASLATVAVAIPLVRIGKRALERASPRPDEPEHLYERKLEVYRTALREASDRGLEAAEERAFLSRLRKDLGVSEDEHRVLLHALDHPGGDRGADRFEIIEELGRGGFGRALLARDTVLDREVVLKEPLPGPVDDAEVRERALREARLAAGINHPNVVTVYEVLADREPPLLVLEYVEGGSLADRIPEDAPMDPREAVALVLDVLEGASALHEVGIVHRDLKPGNILVDADGRARIVDLGVAEPPAEMDGVTLIGDGSQAGSLAYMSPEQAAGEEVDPRSDLYSIGAVLYRLLTGEHYLELAGPPHAIVLRRIQEDEPRLPHDRVPEPIEAWLERALAKDPADRFQHAQEMAEALRRAAPGISDT